MDYARHLREDQWERIKGSLPGKAGDVGRTGDNRRFVEAVMWIGRTGAPCPLCMGLDPASTNGSGGGRKRAFGN